MNKELRVNWLEDEIVVEVNLHRQRETLMEYPKIKELTVNGLQDEMFAALNLQGQRGVWLRGNPLGKAWIALFSSLLRVNNKIDRVFNLG